MENREPEIKERVKGKAQGRGYSCFFPKGERLVFP